MGFRSLVPPLLAGLTVCLQLGSNVQPGQGPHEGRNLPTQTVLSPSKIFSTTSAAVVVIVASSQNDKERALGSGFIVGTNRVVTNHHVMAGMNRAVLLFADGQSAPVSEVIGDSAEQDLIILGAETGSRRPLLLGDEMTLREGDSVYAIGAPKGLELSFTNGIVSSFRKSNSQFLIQATAPIAPGSSGGPLLDQSGHVVGVTTYRISDAPGIYFSVGIGDVKRLLRTPYAHTLTVDEWWEQQLQADGPSKRHAAQKEQSGPSLESTLTWMSDFSLTSGVYDYKDERHTNFFQTERACEGRVTHTTMSQSSSTTQFDTFRLGDIDSGSVVVRTADPNTVSFFTRKNHRIHRRQAIQSSFFPSQTEVRDFDLQSDFLSFDLPASANRFAAALAHAVTLCSAAEPF